MVQQKFAGLSQLFIDLVRQGGVNNPRKSMLVLTVMDLPTKAIVDLDYILKMELVMGFWPISFFLSDPENNIPIKLL